MDLSSFEILKHHKETTASPLTIFREKGSSQEVFLFREEVCKTDIQLKACIGFLNQRRRTQSPHLVSLLKANCDPQKRELNLLMEYSLLNAKNTSFNTFENTLKCILDVLKATADLDACGLYHGNIRPDSILYFPKQKAFKLLDRVFPLSTPFSFYRRQIESQQEVYMSPKLFKEVASKSVKSLKINFQKNDVFSIGIVALKLLYPHKLNLKHLYSIKTKLFDTYGLVESLNQLAKAANSKIETEFLSLVRKKFVCFDEITRLSPAAALREFEDFLKANYSNFESRISWKDITTEPNPEKTLMMKSDSKNSLTSFSSQFTFKHATEKSLQSNTPSLAKIQLSSVQNIKITPHEANPLPLPPTNDAKSKLPLIAEQETFGKNSKFEKIIDFEDLHSEADHATSREPSKEATDLILSGTNTKDVLYQTLDETLNKASDNSENDEMYKIVLKVDVVKVTDQTTLNFNEKLYDLENFSKFAIKFDKESIKIRSKSVSNTNPGDKDHYENHSLSSLNEIPFNLSFISRKSALTRPLYKDSKLPVLNINRNSKSLFKKLIDIPSDPLSQKQVSVLTPNFENKATNPESSERRESHKFFTTFSNLPSDKVITSTCNSTRVNNIYRTLDSNIVRVDTPQPTRYVINGKASEMQNSVFKVQTSVASSSHQQANTQTNVNTSARQAPRIVRRICLNETAPRGLTSYPNYMNRQ